MPVPNFYNRVILIYGIVVNTIITSPPEGVARYCFHPVCVCVCVCVCLSVCLSVCVSVCPANILVFYLSEMYTGYLYGGTQFTKIN